MSTVSERIPSFEHLTTPTGDDPLSAAADAVTTHADEHPEVGVLVVVVRPTDPDHRVYEGGGNGVLRAAVSVAVASGHDRLWADAPGHDTVPRDLPALPEVVAAAADGSGVSTVHVGASIVDDVVRCVALWFEADGVVAPATVRHEILTVLEHAARRDAELAHERAVEQAASGADSVDDDPNAARTFDPDDPRLDAVTGAANRDQFEAALEDYTGDDANLALVGIDELDAVPDTHRDQVLRVTADRLFAVCGRGDLIARSGDDEFAILFAESDRAHALGLVKRMLGAIAEPLPDGDRPTSVSATIAFASQTGLVDTEEMFESATDALASGRTTSPGRLVLAS